MKDLVQVEEMTICSLQTLQYRFIAISTLFLLLIGAVVVRGQVKAMTAANSTRSTSDPAAGSLDEYLRRIHVESVANQPAAGAIWTDGSRFSRLAADVRALQVHDLVQVVVSEGLQSSTDGT
ncbi:MAG TPA: hypothetical protein VIM67_09340, partial [Terriglobus sp.]